VEGRSRFAARCAARSAWPSCRPPITWATVTWRLERWQEGQLATASGLGARRAAAPAGLVRRRIHRTVSARNPAAYARRQPAHFPFPFFFFFFFFFSPPFPLSLAARAPQRLQLVRPGLGQVGGVQYSEGLEGAGWPSPTSPAWRFCASWLEAELDRRVRSRSRSAALGPRLRCLASMARRGAVSKIG